VRFRDEPALRVLLDELLEVLHAFLLERPVATRFARLERAQAEVVVDLVDARVLRELRDDLAVVVEAGRVVFRRQRRLLAEATGFVLLERLVVLGHPLQELVVRLLPVGLGEAEEQVGLVRVVRVRVQDLLELANLLAPQVGLLLLERRHLGAEALLLELLFRVGAALELHGLAVGADRGRFTFGGRLALGGRRFGFDVVALVHDGVDLGPSRRGRQQQGEKDTQTAGAHLPHCPHSSLKKLRNPPTSSLQYSPS